MLYFRAFGTSFAGLHRSWIIDFHSRFEYDGSQTGCITPMPRKANQVRSVPATAQRVSRKSKFQADLAPADDRAIRVLKEELQLSSNSDFLSGALALFRWAASERRSGHKIISESAKGERKVLVLPVLERIAPELELPRVEIEWTERQLASLAKLISAEAAQPTEALIRAVRG